MSVYDNSALTNTIVPIFDMKVLEGRYANSVMLPRVLNKSEKVSKFGSQVQITIEPAYSTGVVTSSTGAFTPSGANPTNVNVVCNIWGYVAIEITDQAEAQAFWTPESTFPDRASKSLAIDYDRALTALHSSFGPNAGDLVPVYTEENPQSFSPDAAKLAMLRMADANIPMEDGNISWALPPIAYFMGWLADPQLTAANSMGVPKNVLTTGYRSPILGVPAYTSTLIATSANGLARKAMLFHKEAMAIALQRDHEYALVDRRPAGFLTKLGVTDSLYGTRAVRTNHAVVVNVKAT